MKKLDFKAKLPYLAVYGCIFLIIFIYTCLSPLVADDFSYSLSWADNSRIHSVGQIVESMQVHRVLTNGRVFVHGLVQFLLMLPKWIFNLLNALIFCLSMHLFLLHSEAEKTLHRIVIILSAFLFLFNFSPAFGQVFLWLTGACNYSWLSCLCLAFLLPYVKAIKSGALPTKLQTVLIVVGGFLLGSGSESVAPAVIFTAVCFTIIYKYIWKRFPFQFLPGIAAAVIGFIFLMTAPASAGRSSGFDIALIAYNVKYILQLVRQDLLTMYLIYAASLAAAIYLKADIKTLLISLVLAVSSAISIAVYAVALYFAQRHMNFALVLIVLATLMLFAEILKSAKSMLPYLCLACMAVLFVFNFLQGSLDIGVVYLQSREREAAISAALDSGDSEITLSSYSYFTRYPAPSGLIDLIEKPDEWPNCSFADYYGFDKVIGPIPE